MLYYCLFLRNMCDFGLFACEIRRIMSLCTVSSFVAQFSEAFAALSVDNCIAACSSVASTAALSLFAKEELAKDCVLMVTDVSQPLSSRALAVFLLERCVVTFNVMGFVDGTLKISCLTRLTSEVL